MFTHPVTHKSCSPLRVHLWHFGLGTVSSPGNIYRVVASCFTQTTRTWNIFRPPGVWPSAKMVFSLSLLFLLNRVQFCVVPLCFSSEANILSCMYLCSEFYPVTDSPAHCFPQWWHRKAHGDMVDLIWLYCQTRPADLEEGRLASSPPLLPIARWSPSTEESPLCAWGEAWISLDSITAQPWQGILVHPRLLPSRAKLLEAPNAKGDKV